jgi:hypothetical protein
MTSVQTGDSKGRDFTAEELVGMRIRIEGPVPKHGAPPVGYAMMVLADDEMINNVSKIVLTIEPNAIVEATLTLYRGETVENEAITEEVMLRDNIELSFSAIVSEVQ